MYIFNTTYNVDNTVKEAFVDWLRATYIPLAIANSELSSPQLCRIITAEEIDGESFSLQFHVADRQSLERWYDSVGESLDISIEKLFGNKVLRFNTLLELFD